MFRAITSLTVLLISCLLAAPAAAGIKRYTDSKGVIRISNTGPAAPRQIPVEPPVVAPPALHIPQEIAPEPEALKSATAPQSLPGEQVDTPVAPEISLPPLWPDFQVANIISPAPEKPEPASSQKAEDHAGPSPVQKVAYTPKTNGPPSSPAAQGESAHNSEVKVEGGIRKFRDRHGVLVITNVPPVTPQAATPLLQAQIPGVGRDLSEKQVEQLGLGPGNSSLRPVSWSPDRHGVVPLLLPGASGRIAAATGGGPIRRYRDKNGVIHIENVGSGGKVYPRPGMMQARGAPVAGEEPRFPPRAHLRKKTAAKLALKPEVRAGPHQKTGLPGSRRDSPGKGPEARLAVKPVARSEVEEAKPPPVLTTAASRHEENALPGSVRRYRDRQGIWHIESVYDHWILEPPPLPGLAHSTEQVLLAAARAVRQPKYNRPPGVAVNNGATALPRVGGIAAVRDSRGHLSITNAPPQAGKGRAPPWVLASAQLDPIIQEAARIYRLPPSLIRAVIKVESNFVNSAISPKGAMGLMQLMPGTAAFLGVQEPHNPRENIHGGCRYLRLLIDSLGGSLPLALAAYNAGYQRVVDSGYRVPEIKETQEFLTQVIGRYIAEEKKAPRPWT